MTDREPPNRSPAFLIVDDDEAIRAVLGRILPEGRYRSHGVGSAAEARAALDGAAWDLVLCDLKLEHESGMSLLAHIRANYPDIPVVIVSGIADMLTARTALDLGAYGYVTKPFDAHQVLIAAENALRRAELEAENAAYRSLLELMVRDRTVALRESVQRLEERDAALRSLSDEAVWTLTRIIEARDAKGDRHIQRMSRYAATLAGLYGLEPAECESIRVASAMHDVGKLGIPDAILSKPGPLSPAEYEVVRQHAELGSMLLAGSVHPALVLAATIARTHHERWDGSGYPEGLAGDAIPIHGRIAALADVFDAVMSPRPYRPARHLDEALEIISEGRGTQFDADLVDLLLAHVDESMSIRAQHVDV